MNKFRPQGITKSYVFKQRLRYGRSDNYNWQTRVKWYPVGWGFNKRVLGNIFGRLHYLACHAPDSVNKQWRVAYNNFQNKHFPIKASVRYCNKYSCHSWI